MISSFTRGTVSVLLLSLAAAAGLQAQAPAISATKTDNLPAGTKVNPGATVTYTNTVTNSGAGNATGVNFADPDVNGATVQMGTLKVSPLAFDDVYTGTIASGVSIDTSVGTQFSATSNDYVGVFNNAAGVLSIVSFDATSANGGAVSMTTSGANVGKFTYTSAAGFTGADTFNYTVSNTGFTSTGTVRLTVSGPGMWFVSPSGNDATGKGTLAAPFQTLTKVATVDANTSQRIFMFTGAYTTGMTLEANEQIVGQGVVGASFDAAVLGIVPGSDSAPRPSINGTKPTITAAAGNVINLADNNTIRGVTINSTVSGFAVAGSATPSLQLGSTVAGTPAADTVVNSTGSSTGCLSLTGSATGTVTVTAQLTATVGRSVNITGRTGGTTSIIGKVTDNGTGISLSSNTGATFNFRCLVLNTGANGAFAATGSSTLNITNGFSDSIDNDGDGTTDEADEANTCVTTTGTSVNLNGVTLGAGGLTFRSINSNGAANGIKLVNVACGSPGLSVVGDNTGFANGSGGSISNTTGGSLGDAPVHALTCSGTISLKSMNMSLNTNCYSGMLVDNNAGGTLAVNVTGCTFIGVTSSVVQNKSLLQFEAGASANVTANVQNSYFSSNRTYGCFATGAGTSVMNVTVNQCGFGTNVNTGAPVNQPGTTITNPPPFSLAVTNGSSAQVDYNITNNTFWGADGSLGAIYAVAISGASTTGSSRLNGSFNFNKIGKTGVTGSGAANGAGALGLLPGTQGAFRATVIGNDIRQVNSVGINFFNSAGPGANSSATLKVKGNTLAEPDTTGSPLFMRAIVVTPGNSGGANNPWIAEIGDTTGSAPANRNIISDGGTAPSGPNTWQTGNYIRVTNNNNTSALTLPGLLPTSGATAAQVNAFVQAANTLPASSINSTLGTAGINGGAALPLLFAPRAVETSDFGTPPDSVLSAIAWTEAARERQMTEPTLPQVASAPEAPAPLTQEQLDALITAARERWVATGLDDQQRAALDKVTFELADLPGWYLGETAGKTLRIDRDAGGNGWFIDTTPMEDGEFAGQGSRLLSASATSSSSNRVDLLTTILHEMGHGIGLCDTYSKLQRNSVMYGFLSTGERRLPAEGQAIGAKPHEHSGSHFLTGAINIGVLPPGKSVTITYDVIVNNPPTTSTLSSQATVSGGNFADVLTDDRGQPVIVAPPTPAETNLPGAADPTVTLIELPDVNLAVSPTSVVEDGAGTLTYTFTRQGATGAPLTVSFAASGTAAATSDYTIASGTGTASFTPGTGLGTLIIPMGQSSATLVLSPSDDLSVEADETATLTVVTGTAYDVGIVTPAATGSILNDDTDVSVAVAPSSVSEDGATNLVYTFTRTGVTAGALTVNFNVTGSATTADSDFIQTGAATFSDTAGTVTFAAASSTATVTLDPTVDNTPEADEGVTFTLVSGAGYTAISPTAAIGTIANDDSTVTVAVAPAATAEDGVTNLVYTFTRTGPSTSALTLNFNVSGTATLAGSDYAQTGAATYSDTAGTISIPATASSASVTINPTADVTSEADETVVLTVAANGAPAATGGYTVGTPSSAIGTIIDDDLPQVSIVATTPTAVEGGATGLYTFTRTQTTGAQVVNFQLDAGSTATAGSDFTLSGATSFNTGTGAGTITFADTVGTATVTLTALAESPNGAEAAETARLNVVAGSGYIAGAPANATVTINANSFLVTTTADSGTGSLRQAIGNANSIAGTDTITFSDGTGGTVNFTDTTADIIDLATVLPDLSTSVTLSGTGADKITVRRPSASPLFRIFNVVSPAVVNLTGLTITGGILNGGNGGGISNAGTLTVSACAISGNAAGTGSGGGIANTSRLTVLDSTISGNTALQGGGVRSSTTSPPFTTASTFTNLVNTTLSGNTVTVGNARGGGLYNFNGLSYLVNCTITGNSAPAPSGSPLTTGGGGVATFSDNSTVTRFANTLCVGNTVSDVDFVASSTNTNSNISLGGNLIGTGNSVGNFAGETTVAAASTILAPLANNGGTTLTHALVPGSPALNTGTSVNAINPVDAIFGDGNDVPLTTDQRGATFTRAIGTVDIGAFELQKSVSIANLAAISEGNSGTTDFTFTITRTGPTTGAVAMTYTVGGAAVDAADFGGTLPTGIATIPDGSATTTVTIPVSGDVLAELDEAFTVTLSAPDNGYVVTGAPATSTINNDDTLSVTINQAVAQADPSGAGSDINFTAVFSEPVTDFDDAADVTLTGTPGATTTLITGGPTTYNIAVSGMTGSGTVIASVPATVALSAGNAGNVASSSTDNTVTYDSVAPALATAITFSDTALKIGDTSTVTFTFTEAITGFTEADVTVQNGTLSTPSSSNGGITWTATLTPNTGVTDATNFLTLANTGYSDAAGNTGVGTNSSDNYEVDTVRPTVASIFMADTALTVGETSLVTITFSEAVTGFDNADLTIPNGNLTNVTSGDGGTTWTATFTPTAGVIDATNVITVDKTGITDLAGNAGIGTTDSGNFTIDTLAVTLAATNTTAEESGATGLYTFTRNNSSGDMTVNFQLDASSTATAATDFTLTSSGTLTFTAGTGAGTIVIPNGQTTATVVLTALTESVNAAEADETARLNVVAGSGYAIGTPADATVTITENGFHVTTTADSGTGSLRQAVLNANSIAGTDTVTFSDGTGGTVNFTDSTADIIDLATVLPNLTTDININGTGADKLTVRRPSGAATQFRIFNVDSSTVVNVSGLTLTGGDSNNSTGGGIFSVGNLTLTACVISGNTAGNSQGGGIYFNGFANGRLTVRDSTISGNTANKAGGVYSGTSNPPFNSASTVTILINTTLSGNTVSGSNSVGGGFFNENGLSYLVNCTLTGNSAPAPSGSPLTTGGGGAATYGDNLTVTRFANTLCVGNSGSDVNFVSGNTNSNISLGGNLIGMGNSGANFPGQTTAATANTILGPLANNGGPTLTHALIAGSPALNTGTIVNATNPTDAIFGDGNDVALTSDQRGTGFTRAIGPVDIGAFELQKSVSIGNLAAISEGNSGTTNFVFTITRTGLTAGAVAMTYTVGGAAVNGTDFVGGTLPTGTATIADGSATTTVTIPVSGDSTVEPNEAFTVTLSAPDNGYVVIGAPATSAINNDDSATVTLAKVTDGTEAGTSALFRVTQTAASSTDTTLSYTVGGTATSGTDFTALSGSVTILAGQLTADISVAITDDRLVEGTETLSPTLTGITAGSSAVSLGSTLTATADITDNDIATLSFSTGPASASESAGTQNVGTTLSINATGTGAIGLATNLTADLTSTGGTATGSGTDYTLPGSPALTFLAGTYATGSATQNASVTITDDRLVEGNETAIFGLGIVTNIGTQVSIGGITGHTLTLTDNDTVTLGFTTASSSTLESAGTQNVNTTLSINAIGTGTIGLASNLTANLTSTGGTATGSGTDYTLPSSPAVTFLAGTYATGTATQNGAVTITDDRQVEGSETAALGLSIATNIGTQGSIGGTTAHTLTLTDNDTATLGFTTGTSTALESIGTQNVGTTLTINAIGTGSIGLASNLTANLTTTGGTATGSGTDYTLPSSPAVTFVAGTYATGTATQNAAITVINDLIVESNETADLGLSIATNIGTQASLGGITQHTLTITDNDVATVTLAKITDGAETPTSALFRVTQTAPASVDTVITYTTGGTASGTDFTAPSGSVTILAGNTTADISVTIINDALVEATETLSLTLTGFTARDPDVSLGTTLTATADVTDNDTATVTIAKITDGAEPSTNGLFRVTQTAQSSTNTVVTYAVTGTAASGTDFTALSGSVTILAGQTTADISVSVTDETLVEGTETVIATLNGFSAGDADITLGATVAATVNLTDNDTATVTLAKITDGVEAAVSTNALFRVTQTAAASTDTVISYTVGGTATSGTDFTALSGSVTILAGQTTADISVAVLNENVVEATETVSLTLTGFTARDPEVTLGATVTASANITDSDTATVTLAKITDGAETPTSALFRVTQSAAASVDTVITYATGGSATSGSDFTAPSGSVTILAGNTTADISVTITNDALVEATETLSLTLTGFTARDPDVSLGSTLTTAANITDNDTATLSIIKQTDGAESNTPTAGSFRISQSALSSVDTVVNLSITGSATSGSDFTTLPASATILAGQSFVDVSVPVLNDNIIESTETVIATLGSLASGNAGITIGATSAATVNITDNDVAFSIAVNSGSGQSATVNTAFASPLVAIVRDSGGVALQGASVTFTAPGSGASGAFGASATVVTNALGLATAPAFTANTISGSYTVTAATTGVIPTASFSLTNNAGAATKYLVSAPGSAVAGVPVDVTVTAQDAFNNIATAYPGTVRITSSDAAAILPSNSTLTSGTRIFSVNFSTGGNQTVTAIDTVSSAITGTSGNVSVSPRADLAVTLTDSPDPVNALGNLTYTVTLTNNGPSASVAPSVSLPLPAFTTFVSASGTAGWTPSTPGVGSNGTVSFSNSTLASGATASFTIVAKVDLNVVNNSTLTATVTASETTTDPVGGNNSAQTTTTARSGADRVATLTAAPEPVIAGTELTYTLQLRNNGPLDAENAALSFTLPPGTTFVSIGTNSGWTATTPAVGSGGTVSITNSLFAPGTVSFPLVVKVGSDVVTGSILNANLNSSSTTIDVAPGNESASTTSNVITRSDLAIDVSGTPTTAPKGSDVIFTIVLTNNGPSDAVNPFVSFPIPAQMTFATVAAPSGWAVSSPAIGAGGTVTFAKSGLINGAVATFTVAAKVKTSAPNGTIITATATASATGTDLVSGNNSDSATAAVGTTTPTSLQLGTTGTLNRLNGLFELTVNVTNTTPLPINGFRLHVNFTSYLAAYPSLRLYNASSALGSPDVYVDYPFPVAVDGVIPVKLSFYTSTRTFPSPFAPVLTVETLATSAISGPAGAGVQPRLVRLTNGNFMLEFDSVPGRWYRVRYSDDLNHWFDSPVPIQAANNRMQWIDSGAPFTVSPSSSVPSRYYLVNEIPVVPAH